MECFDLLGSLCSRLRGSPSKGAERGVIHRFEAIEEISLHALGGFRILCHAPLHGFKTVKTLF
jgi:hypothetical protein